MSTTTLADRMLAAAERPGATRALGFVSFIESSVFPIPPDIMLIPMVLAKPARWLWLATVTTAASVLGGVLGYVIGMWAFEAVAQPVLSLYGYGERFESFRDLFNEWGWLLVFGAGLTPFPYKVITIAAGAAALNPIIFILASIVGRGARFYAVAGILRIAGPPAQAILKKHFATLTIIGCGVLLAAVVVYKLVR